MFLLEVASLFRCYWFIQIFRVVTVQFLHLFCCFKLISLALMLCLDLVCLTQGLALWPCG